MAVLEALLVLFVFGCILALALLAYVFHAQNYWQRRGVYVPQTGSKILGHFSGMITRKRAFPYVMTDIYDDLKKNNKKVGGIYQFSRPSLMIIDPDLIREVTIKHFDHFTDRRPFIQGDVDKVLGRSLLSLKGDEWRDIRHQLSPAFTGSKLRGMIDLMDAACHQLIKYFANRPDYKEPVDINEAVRKFAADVISTTAFGTVSDSLSNPDAPFFNNGIKLMDTSGLRALVFAGYLVSPKLMEFIKVPFVPKILSDFFTDTITSTIHFRETQNKSRPDMIQLLLEARKAQEKQGKKITISDVDIVAQAFTFFLGGFDTIATELSFCLQLLAMHPEVQDRLRNEVDEAFEQGEGKISYDAIQELKYMDMVLSEVLRMYPAAPMIDRLCTKSFDFKEYGIRLDEGISVSIPIQGLHYDPDYFPDPERFDPERFSEENKDKIKQCVYLPFGSGPRNCIGLRFAQVEVKLCLAYILATNELDVCAKTQIPIVISANSTAIRPEGGFWATVRPRKNPSIKV